MNKYQGAFEILAQQIRAQREFVDTVLNDRETTPEQKVTILQMTKSALVGTVEGLERELSR